MKIYLISDNESRYKIGFSSNPKSRLKQLQTGGATVYDLLYEIECNHTTKVEKTLHRYYAQYRRHGEWFELIEEDVKNFPNMVKKIEGNLSMISSTSTLRKILMNVRYLLFVVL